MENLTIKYCTYSKALPPQPIRIKTPGWGGSAERMQDGAEAQPWHCLPFVEGSVYGLELLYQFEKECQVVNDQGSLRFEWDSANEPGNAVTGGEFIAFAPKRASKYYLFNTRLDVQAPPGHVVRTEPHPRFFTDDSGTVPLSMIGHMQTEWYPRLLFVVFRAPEPGQRHVFRNGEPYAQILFVPRQVSYELIPMTAVEEAQRRLLAQAIEESRFTIADHIWQNSDGPQQDNHYKILARIFARDGLAGVEEAVQKATERREVGLKDKSIADCLAQGRKLMSEQKRSEAAKIYNHVLGLEPNNAEALNNMGICLACSGNVPIGVEMMLKAVALQPMVPVFHSSLGEILRLLGRFQEAEGCFRSSLHLNPNDQGIWSVLGLTLAQQGRTEEGLQACQTALALGYPVPAVNFRMGLVLSQLRRYVEARSYFEAALAGDPNFADARRALQELPR